MTAALAGILRQPQEGPGASQPCLNSRATGCWDDLSCSQSAYTLKMFPTAAITAPDLSSEVPLPQEAPVLCSTLPSASLQHTCTTWACVCPLHPCTCWWDMGSTVSFSLPTPQCPEWCLAPNRFLVCVRGMNE